MTMLGYQNNVLRINLKEKTASTEPLRMDFARKYIGSKGLAIRYMKSWSRVSMLWVKRTSCSSRQARLRELPYRAQASCR